MVPFIGEVTAVSGIMTVVLFAIGYMVGTSIKSGIKFGMVALLLIVVMYAGGILGADVIKNIVEIVSFLKPMMSNMVGEGSFVMQMSLQFTSFLAGFLIGVFKG